MSDETRTETPGTWLAEIEARVWAMEPRALATLLQVAADGTYLAWVERRAQAANAAEIEARRDRGRPRAISGGVTTVPLKGVLAPPHPILALFFGIENPVDVFRRGLREALADDDVGAVVVEVDSPGGVIDGIPEAAAEIRSLRGSKPIVANANGMAASAAYWLASQADEVVMTPSGAVGSIGVYATHRDFSGAFKLMGVEHTLVKAGRYKAEANPLQPLSDEAREHIQEDVDHFYGLFVADVAKGRGATAKDVRAGYGEGRVLNAKAAQAANLVDRVETLGETVARLSSRSRGAVGVRGEADEPDPELEGAEADAGADDDPDAVVYSREERERIIDALGV